MHSEKIHRPKKKFPYISPGVRNMCKGKQKYRSQKLGQILLTFPGRWLWKNVKCSKTACKRGTAFTCDFVAFSGLWPNIPLL